MIRHLRILRRPRYLILIGGIVFVSLGTFYWSLWDVPWWVSKPQDQQTDQYSPNVSPYWQPWDEDLSDADGAQRPLRPVCTPRATPDVSNMKNYCSWNRDLTSCYEVLKTSLLQETSWVFLGDVGMARIPNTISRKSPFDTFNVTARRNACQNLAYYSLPPPDHEWIAPDPLKGEGPMGYGKDRPYCMDCRRCWNVLLDDPSQPKHEYLEYLVVEYSRDVSLPTLISDTTQETVAYYLSQKQEKPSVCVANTGLLEAGMVPALPVDLYKRNVDHFLGLLQRVCHSVIWMSIPAVVESDRLPQSNCRLREWNDEVIRVIQERNYQNVYYLDVWERNFNTDYRTAATPNEKYYESLARLFVKLYTGSDT